MDIFKKMTDEELVKYIILEDKELFIELVLRYQDKLYRYAYSLARDNHKATDIVQNSFIKSFVNLNSFNPDFKFSTWIYRIVHNEALNEIKKNKNEIEIPDDFDIISDEDIESNFDQNEIGLRVRQCVSLMPIKYSEPLTLFYLEEKSYDEISDILRIPIGTVGTRINRAKILMKKICQTKN
jgi:RNA polymerase sigma-70 factor, ECF subfamily